MSADAPSAPRPEVQHLYERLKSVNEKKGYFFNPDLAMSMDLIEGLLTNKERYGYMCCPCRLAANDREFDRDITCPCDYRSPDVEEYGACYCALYVTEEWIEGTTPHRTVPERRPPEKQAW